VPKIKGLILGLSTKTLISNDRRVKPRSSLISTAGDRTTLRVGVHPSRQSSDIGRSYPGCGSNRGRHRRRARCLGTTQRAWQAQALQLRQHRAGDGSWPCRRNCL